GSLRSCRDPNGGCLSRISRAQASNGRSAPQSQFRPPTRDEVEFFVEENELNERAAEALRGAAPAVQREVMEQGSLRTCREPSAGCIGRIGKAQKQQHLDPAPQAKRRREWPSPDDVENFIADNHLDGRASNALRGAAHWVQQQVMDQGSLRTCRDPNAGCIGRLHRAQLVTHTEVKLVKNVAVLPDEVERFIQDNRLSGRAASMLRAADPTVQRKVLDRGSLYGTRDPNASCIGRIGKFQRLPGPDRHEAQKPRFQKVNLAPRHEDHVPTSTELQAFILDAWLMERDFGQRSLP
ncbi:unnamed protein product, partial [Symbiodinium pilosum]